MISCKDYVAIQKEIIKDKIKTFNRKPKLCVLQIGDNPASNTYVKNKRKDCNEVGIEFEHVHIKDYENVSQKSLYWELVQINADETVDGIIIQLPIPDKYNVEELQKCISPEKDVDGFRPDSCFKPCTPKGIDDWLEYNNYNLEGKNVVVLGRSKIVGLPMTNICIDRGATVTCCNSKTNKFSLLNHLRNADLVISAVGKPKFLNYSKFLSINGYKAEVIVDVGINRDENGKLCGDVDPEGFEEYLPNTYLTPVPGGVGLTTRLRLMQNTVEAYELHSKGGE